MRFGNQIEITTQLNTLAIPIQASLVAEGFEISTKLPIISNIGLATLINPNLSFQTQGTVSPTIYGAIEQDITSYLWRSFFDTIPVMDLEENLKEFEQRYQTTSAKFFEQWERGEFEDTKDTNQWASLYLQLRNP